MQRNQPQHPIASLPRVALVALVAVAALTGASASCDSQEAAGPAELDPGPTFGAEIVVSIVGRGRVTSSASAAGAIDCPSTCFARIVLDDPTFDGSTAGVTLTAESSSGARFDHWELEAVELGARARGPAQCSPVTRMTERDGRGESGTIDPTFFVVTLHFGEALGKSPVGREAECADFTAVPVAYAITATFAEDYIPRFDGGGEPPALTPLFEPPPGYPGAAREIGVAGGSLYWRFQQSNGLSGVATGLSSGRGVGAAVIVEPFELIDVFDVARSVVYQDRNGMISAIQGGDTFVRQISPGGGTTCSALASDSANVYCRRGTSGGSSTLYAWSLFGGLQQPEAVYVLPPGNALFVDEQTQRIYYSDDPGGFGQAVIKSAPRNNDGDSGIPISTTLAVNQTSPGRLVAGSSYLFWLDARGADSFAATATSKFSFSTPQVSQSGTQVRFIAADPNASSTYWIGLSEPGAGRSSILRAFPGAISPPAFRTGITGLGGIAVDSTYVYWTESDGRVYGLPKNDFDL